MPSTAAKGSQTNPNKIVTKTFAAENVNSLTTQDKFRILYPTLLFHLATVDKIYVRIPIQSDLVSS